MESLFKTRRNMLLNDHIANKYIMKKPIFFLIVFFISVVCNSQSSKQDIIDNIYLSGGSLTAYTGPLQDTLTPSPIGKKPFYISTYCRHGSRHLMEANYYTAPIDALKAAKNAGALTNFGNQILERMEIMNENSLNRYGELTKIGLDQWQGIAKRMIRNFPEIFSDSSSVDGRSSIFIRCILSMETLLQELKAFNPQLKIFHDACENDMSFILPGYSPSKASTRNEAPIAKTIALPTINGDRIAEEFFSKQYIKKINTSNFMLYLFDLASQIQNTELRDSFSLYEIFNDDELYDVWKRKNVSAYNSYHKGGSTGVLLKRILDDADKAIANNSPCAHFRFGHESVLLPLVCRMSLNNYDQEYDSAEELEAANWKTYRIYPMASNIQIIFYRSSPSDSDILVKILLNEGEVTLPIDTDIPPYYHWNDVREYWKNKQ